MPKPKMKKTALMAMISGLLAAGAILPFMRTKSEARAPIPAEKLIAAIKENWDDNSPTAISNIVKNINFPAFMPVDENGQFSEEKAQKAIDALKIDKNREVCQSFFEGKCTFDEFCQAFIGEDKAKQEQLAPIINELKTYAWGETKGEKDSLKTHYYDVMKWGSGALIPLCFLMILGGTAAALGEGNPLELVAAGAVAIGLMYLGTKGLIKYERLGDELRLSNYRADLVQKALHTVQQDMYDAYVKQTIAGEKDKIIKLNQEQTKQMMKWFQNSGQPGFYFDIGGNFRQ